MVTMPLPWRRLATATTAAVVGVGVLALQGPALAAGLANPAHNVVANPAFATQCGAPAPDNSAGCIAATLAAINNARAAEGVGPMTLPTTFASMPAVEQMLVVMNLERTDRGLPPYAGTNVDLDAIAQQGATAGGDPAISPPPYAGSAFDGSSDFASGPANPLGAFYGWMYDDGPNADGSPPFNVGCTSPTAPHCWDHRDSILSQVPEPNLTLGAAEVGTSWTLLLIVTVGAPPSLEYNWSAITQGSTGGPGPNPAPPASCTPMVGPDTPGRITRTAGADRDRTSVAVSLASFPTATSAKAVVLASDANFPDALSGGPLAVALGGPLLVTSPAGLAGPVETEIQRVLPAHGTVDVLGGTLALPTAIDDQLTADGFTVHRVQGPDRFATAVAVADALGSPTTVFEASGTGFADALAAGPAAAAAKGAVLLTNGSAQAAATATYLAAHPGTDVAVGGPAASADPHARAIAGSDRYETAVMVTQGFLAHPTTLGFATGAAFPDALAGVPAVAKAGGGLLLVPSCGPLPSSVTGLLTSVGSGVTGGILFGGPLAVDPGVLTQINSLVAPA